MLASLLVLSAALAPSLPPRAAVRAASSGPAGERAPPATMVFHQRSIALASLKDRELLISKVRLIAEEVCAWTAEDWKLYDAPPARLKIDHKASRNARSVVIEYAGWGGQGRDGALGIEVEDQTNAIGMHSQRLVWTTTGSRREDAEEILFRLVLEEVRRGELSKVCTLSPSMFPLPRSSRAALLAVVIENRRLRKQLNACQAQGEATRDAAASL